tara:strand:+ start:93 stop:509 length:417 start_codon:yes stop_codon:yes gene_type:complete
VFHSFDSGGGLLYLIFANLVPDVLYQSFNPRHGRGVRFVRFFQGFQPPNGHSQMQHHVGLGLVPNCRSVEIVDPAKVGIPGTPVPKTTEPFRQVAVLLDLKQRGSCIQPLERFQAADDFQINNRIYIHCTNLMIVPLA